MCSILGHWLHFWSSGEEGQRRAGEAEKGFLVQWPFHRAHAHSRSR